MGSSCSSSSSLNGDTIPAADASLKHNSAQRRGCCCAQKRKKGSAPPESYYRAFSAAVLLLVTSSVAVSVKNLGVILGLIGSTAYMALMFILPGAFGRRLAMRARLPYWKPTCLCIFGIILGIVCTFVTIYGNM